MVDYVKTADLSKDAGAMLEASARRIQLDQLGKTIHSATKPVVEHPGLLPSEASQKMGPPEHILQFFAFAHLPAHLQEVSRPFGELADVIVKTLPRNPERTAALRKLLEAKDAAIRALVAK